MSDNNESDGLKAQGETKDISVGEINIGGDLSGNIIIGHTTGYTPEQVSNLLSDIASRFQPRPFDGRCPYKGLDVFEEEDADLFFGRERLVENLVNRVKEARSVFITGPSGSGKSSLVRAGLIHALKQGKIKNSERWLYETMKPGRDPIGELVRIVSGLAGTTSAGDEVRAKSGADVSIFARWCEIVLKEGQDKRLVLFVDQFEEVFTQVGKEIAETFIDLLTYSASVENGRVILLFAMRSDFVSNCAAYPALNALLSRQFIQIGTMEPEELVSAIAQPALRVDLRIDPDLIVQIINDMKGEPGSLPLVQFALKDLFDSEQAKGGVIELTRNDYLERGGIDEALQRHADDSFARLNDHEKELARAIFSNLIEINQGMQATRRTAMFDELVSMGERGKEVKAIVQKLADARLITTGEKDDRDTVTLAHEKLIEAWPWLKKLVNESQDAIALQNEIASDAREWDGHNRDKSYLYTGARLTSVREKLGVEKLALGGTAQEFIRAGAARQRRSQVAGFGSIAVIIALLVVAVVTFKDQSNRYLIAASAAQTANVEADAQKGTAQANAKDAQNQAKIAQAGELVARAQSVSQGDPDLSFLLGVEAWLKNDNYRTRSTLLNSLQAYPHLRKFLYNGDNDLFLTGITDLAFSPNGKFLAASNCSSVGEADVFCGTSRITLWDIAKGTRVGEPIDQPIQYEYGESVSLAFSPNNETLAAFANTYSFGLFALETKKSIDLPYVTGKAVTAIGHNSDIFAYATCSKGISQTNCGDYDPMDQIVLVNTDTGKPIRGPLGGDIASVTNLAFSADDKTLVSVGCMEVSYGYCVDNKYKITLWNLESNISTDLSSEITGNTLILSPQGGTIAVSDNKNSIFLWNIASGQQLDLMISGSFVGFTQDGKTLATQEKDGSISLWNTETGQQRCNLASDLPLAFSPDGRTVATIDNGITIVLWDVETGHQMDQLSSGTGSPVTQMAFNQNGSMLAAGNRANTIALFDLTTDFPIAQQFSSQNSAIDAMILAPSQRTLTSVDIDGTVLQWDLGSRENIGKSFPIIGRPIKLTFDSSQIASTSCEKESNDGEDCVQSDLYLWDLATGRQIGIPRKFSGSIQAISPDGKIIASVICSVHPQDSIFCDQEDIVLSNMDTGQSAIQTLAADGLVFHDLTFSSDGKTLVSAGCSDFHVPIGLGCAQYEIDLWNVATRQILSRSTFAASDIFGLILSPNNTMLALTGPAGIYLWDMDKHQLTSLPLNEEIDTLALSHDGSVLAVGTCDSYDKNDDCNKSSIVLWDLATHQQIGQALPGHKGYISSLIFSADDKTLWSSGSDAIILQWDLDPKAWITYICDRAGRNMTRDEWGQYITDKPYPSQPNEATCKDLPLSPAATPTPQFSTLPLSEETKTPFPVLYPTVLPCPDDLSTPSSGGLININTASSCDLEMLPGIGPTTAQRIVDYRTLNGPFVKIEDILNVSGIGPSTFAGIQDLITVSSPESDVTSTPTPTPDYPH